MIINLAQSSFFAPIAFTIDSEPYGARQGMSWYAWAQNTPGASCRSLDRLVNLDGGKIVLNGAFVKGSDKLVANQAYMLQIPDPTITVSYDANGGSFTSGTTNFLEYIPELNQEITLTSKTSNVSEDGTSFTGKYASGSSSDFYGITDTITIPGADKLEVTITYQTSTTTYDWVAVYDNSVTPSRDNFASSISGKLGDTTKTTKKYTIEGDTVQFFFRASSNEYNYFGYYATVTGVGDCLTKLSGEYKEPTHGNSDLIFDGWYTDADCTTGNEFVVSPYIGNTIAYAKWKDVVAPTLTVSYPYSTKNNSPTYLHTQDCIVSGTASDGVQVDSLMVNGNSVDTNINGSWSTSITLDPDVITPITVVASDGVNSTTAKRYAYYNKSGSEIIYNANGGYFILENTISYNTNTVRYKKKIENRVETKIAKTSNVNDDGSWDGVTTHPRTSGQNTTITIPGADQLEVTITYQTYDTYTSFVMIFDSSAWSNKDEESISYRLGGTVKNTRTFIVKGDSVRFRFFSSQASSANRKYYGYYATVTNISDFNTGITAGQYTEPTHSNSNLVFAGWYTDPACSDGNEFVVSPNMESTTVYAKWVSN